MIQSCFEPIRTGQGIDLVTDSVHRRSFALWLSNELRDRKLNQAEFARRAGISAALVSNWITGGRIPSIQSAQTIADALDVDVRVVLTVLGLELADDSDPTRMRIKGMIDQARLTPDRAAVLQGLLQMWADHDRDASGS